MEKTIRSLQNEKAVLSAAVDARDSKLVKMEDLQTSVHSLTAEVSKGDALRSELVSDILALTVCVNEIPSQQQQPFDYSYVCMFLHFSPKE